METGVSMFDSIFNEFEKLHVAVVGDIMLDTYWWGTADRISPEAPVPVVNVKSKEYRTGGAGNVALNLLNLGARVSMHSVTGTDEDGLLLEIMMKDKGINTEGVWKSDDRLTTNKIRIVSRNQQLLRLDYENSNDLLPEKEQRFIEKTIALFDADKPDVVIFEDYNKGVLTEKVIKLLIAYCQQQGIMTAVDPKRRNFFAYKGVDIFKPNLKEVRDALNLADGKVELDYCNTIHSRLAGLLEHSISLITLSEHGVFVHDGQGGKIIPAHLRNIADVSGAGDTVIAVASLVYAATKDATLMAEVSNLAGGLVCEEVGTIAIDGDKLLEECNRLLADNSAESQMADG
jgi:rfaE bifunctional protein kinase chain/domain